MSNKLLWTDYKQLQLMIAISTGEDDSACYLMVLLRLSNQKLSIHMIQQQTIWGMSVLIKLHCGRKNSIVIKWSRRWLDQSKASKKQTHFGLHIQQIKVDWIKQLIIIADHLLIRVHLIRHCYPLLRISDMGIKCWTCSWVILENQRATTYTPLNQWGSGFAVRQRVQHESVFPEQSRCPRSGFALNCSIFRKTCLLNRSLCVCILFFNFMWFKDQTEQSDSCILHSRSRGRPEHLNPIAPNPPKNKTA